MEADLEKSIWQLGSYLSSGLARSFLREPIIPIGSAGRNGLRAAGVGVARALPLAWPRDC
jgi:hypothetical protein